MKSFLRILCITTLSLFLEQQISAQIEITLFTSTPVSIISNTINNSQPVKVISFEGNRSNNKVSMKWVVAENETADQFEVERSADGKNFSMVALVFGTDKTEIETYKFYEKNISGKVSYRIKCIDKDQRILYSDILVIDPSKQ